MAKKKPAGDQKLYRNEGVTRLVLEGVSIQPGDEFRASLHPEHEQQLIMGGHISILEDQSANADTRQAEAIIREENRGPVVVPTEAEESASDGTESASGRRKRQS